jgi:mannose-6-phosphate isomerase class I
MLKVLNEEIFKNPENYSIITVVEGEFELSGYKLVLGDSFILTKKANQIKIKGDGILVRTDVKS